MRLARNGILATLGVMLMSCALAPMRAQDKQSAPTETKRVVPIKVVVVVTELDGAKKISSLPYTFFVNTDDSGNRNTSQVRVGLRVPVAMSAATNGAATQFQYMDIGTNIDCMALTAGEGRFKLALSVERSYLTAIEGNKTLAGEGVNVSSGNPIVQHFSSSYNLLIRDGQTVEATSTTDPISGRVLQISVTANTVK